jgi:hypothetical protein
LRKFAGAHAGEYPVVVFVLHTFLLSVPGPFPMLRAQA